MIKIYIKLFQNTLTKIDSFLRKTNKKMSDNTNAILTFKIINEPLKTIQITFKPIDSEHININYVDNTIKSNFTIKVNRKNDYVIQNLISQAINIMTHSIKTKSQLNIKCNKFRMIKSFIIDETYPIQYRTYYIIHSLSDWLSILPLIS